MKMTKTSKPKTLGDFPKFKVTAVRRGATYETGYTRFAVEGNFDSALESRFKLIAEADGVKWFWLLFGTRDCICATLESFDKQTKTAVLTCHETEEPKILGLELSYLSAYWQAYNIWMVLDPNWGWERREFQGTDAVAEDYEAKDVSFVGEREVKIWTKLEPVGVSSGQSRHYPADDQTLPVRTGTRLVPGASGHEHCGLCNDHIDAGAFGYRDLGARWLCEGCHERYVARRDLAFVDEL
jgi:hypothetical protein